MPGFHVITFGCQMNRHDSSRMSDVLEGAGYRSTPGPETADVLLLNTCSVREKAVQKLRSEVGRLSALKRRRPEMLIGITGCVAQQEGERLLARMPHVDLIVGPDNIPELPDLLADLLRGGPPAVRTELDLGEPSFLMARPRPASRVATAFVTTMKGCDERCTFCIVPTTRGPERYRPSSEVLAEVRAFVDSGVREVTLLGQTVDSYVDPLGALGPRHGLRRRSGRVPRDESEFPCLLRAIAGEVPELDRLRYTSPHPRHLTPSLIDAHRDLPVLAKHVHMPVQSGSNRVLRRMLRRYTVEEYAERIAWLRSAVPGLTLSTDVIVGFPGETEGDFEATLELVRRCDFVGVFGFKYSPRPGTPALKLGDDVDEAEKSRRLAALFELSEARRTAHLASLVGSTQSVLFEGSTRDSTFTGRTERNEIVHTESSRDLTAEIVDVRIEEAFKHSLRAAPVDFSPRSPVPSGERHRALPVV